MLDKEVFTQDLKQVFTILQELKVIEKYIKELIDKYKYIPVNEEVIQYVNSIKDYIIQDENTTQIGCNLEVDGTLTVNSDTNINGILNIDSFDNIIDSDDENLLDIIEYYASSFSTVYRIDYNPNNKSFISDVINNLNGCYLVWIEHGVKRFSFGTLITTPQTQFTLYGATNLRGSDEVLSSVRLEYSYGNEIAVVHPNTEDYDIESGDTLYLAKLWLGY